MLCQGVHSGWKSWKMSPFSEFLAGKAGILVLGLILLNSFII